MSTQRNDAAVIRVKERDGKLIVTAAKGQMKSEILTGLQEHKAELVEFLSRFGGQGVVREAQDSDYLDEHGESWAVWKARALNRLFKEQGATGKTGRITAATVARGEWLITRAKQEKSPLL
jgi:hypothetical protein